MKRDKQTGIQFPFVIIVLMIVIVGALIAGYVGVDELSLHKNDGAVPANYYDNEVRSGSQLIEVSITP